MKEVTFITFDGVTKICSIPNKIRLDYHYLILRARKELSVQNDYRIKVFNEGNEDALNSLSNIQSGDKYFVLFQQSNPIKTDELIYFITIDIIKLIIIKRDITESRKLEIYNIVDTLINEGALIEQLYSTIDFRWIMSYIGRNHDVKLLKLLLNNGLSINHKLITRFIADDYSKQDDIIDLFLLYKIDLRYHYDKKCNLSMKNLGSNYRFIDHFISKKILELNTIIIQSNKNTAFYYYIFELDNFLQTYPKYNDCIDYNLPALCGNTFLSMDISDSTKKNFVEKLTKYPKIDINKQYRLTANNPSRTKYIHLGDTLLHMVCRSKIINIGKIQLLLDRDAKLIKNDNGETQIDVLKNRQSTKLQQKVLQILKKHFNILSIE